MGLFLNFKVMSLIINTKKSNGHTLTKFSVVFTDSTGQLTSESKQFVLET